MLPLLLLPLDLLLQGQDVQVEVPGDDAAVAAVLGHPVLPATQLPRAVSILPGEEIRNAAFNHNVTVHLVAMDILGCGWRFAGV